MANRTQPAGSDRLALQSDKAASVQHKADCTHGNGLRLCYPGDMIRHTVNGRTVLTIEDLAEKHGLAVDSVYAIIARENHAGRPIPVADHCGRKALYDPRVFAKALKQRPGRGSKS